MMCPKCYGTGSQSYVGKQLHKCLRCDGKGVVKSIKESDMTLEYLAYTMQYKPKVA